MNFKIKLKLVLKDENGKIIKTINKNCHSFVRQLIDLLAIQIQQSSLAVNDTNGVSQMVNPNSTVFNALSAYADNTFGIQIGTGTTPISMVDYAITSLIENGASANKIMYNATEINIVEPSGVIAYFEISRAFLNMSGSDITVNEVGLTVKVGTYYFLIEHSLLSFLIANITSCALTYTISVST